MKKFIPLGVLLLILFMGGCYSCNTQRSLVNKDEAVKSAWANVQTQYQRRADLIDNLVATVKGAANFEKETLTAVIEARASASKMTLNANDLTPEKLQQFQASQGQLSQALGRLMVVSEQYPELKANQNFLALQDEISGTENRIAFSRTSFNDAVQAYNITVRTFPNNLLAGTFGFQSKGMFEAEVGTQKAPKVQF
jgi:LemA protein